jgi:hypothetical protein
LISCSALAGCPYDIVHPGRQHIPGLPKYAPELRETLSQEAIAAGNSPEANSKAWRSNTAPGSPRKKDPQ